MINLVILGTTSLLTKSSFYNCYELTVGGEWFGWFIPPIGNKSVPSTD